MAAAQIKRDQGVMCQSLFSLASRGNVVDTVLPEWQEDSQLSPERPNDPLESGPRDGGVQLVWKAKGGGEVTSTSFLSANGSQLSVCQHNYWMSAPFHSLALLKIHYGLRLPNLSSELRAEL